MDFGTYVHRNLDLMIRVFSDIGLALRKKEKTKAYKLCLGFYNDLKCAEIQYLEDEEIGLTENDLLFLFSRAYIYCEFYCNEIDDNAVRNETMLLGRQIFKRMKKMIQSFKSRGYYLL